MIPAPPPFQNYSPNVNYVPSLRWCQKKKSTWNIERRLICVLPRIRRRALYALISITFNTNTRLPQERLSQRHIAWDTCALPWSQSTHHEINFITLRSHLRQLEIEGTQLLTVFLDISNLRTSTILYLTMLSTSSIFNCGTPKPWALTIKNFTPPPPHHIESLYPSICNIPIFRPS